MGFKIPEYYHYLDNQNNLDSEDYIYESIEKGWKVVYLESAYLILLLVSSIIKIFRMIKDICFKKKKIEV